MKTVISRTLVAGTALLLGTGAGAQDPPAPADPFRQVQMHVWISETNESGLRDLGANLLYRRAQDNSGDSLQQISTNVFNPVNPEFTVTLPAPDPDRFLPPLRPDQDGGQDGIQSQAGAGLTFTVLQSGTGTLDGVFRAIERKNDLDLISKPELLVIEGKTATIQAGGKVPYQDLQFDNKGNPQLNVTFQNIGVEMEVTPTIVSDELVSLNLAKLNVTDVVRFDNVRGVDLPVFATRSQTGVVLVPNGQALVIGGLSSRTTRRIERRVPVLGKLPLIGIPFRGRQSETLDLHLLIFVAPTIVDLRQMTPAANNALDFWRNGSWRNEEVIQEEIELMGTER